MSVRAFTGWCHLPMHLVRALAPPRFAAGVLVTLALLSAACSDSASRINAPPLLSSPASHGSSGAGSSGPSLGAASGFAVLGGTSVTCTGSAVIGGDVGVSPGTSVTGFPPTGTLCTLAGGTIHAGDAVAAAAHNDFLTAYDALVAMTCPVANNLTGQDLGGMTLEPGVYCFPNTTAALTGQLTLTGSGPWVFQIGTGLTTSTGTTPASVVMAGGDPCNVFWQVGTQATIGTNTAFQGNILAGTAIEFSGTGSSLIGRALAKAEVTMTGTNVSLVGCGGAGAPSCKVSGDRVTGGGWIRGPSGAKANFAVSGGINIRRNTFRGHLEYLDDKGSRAKGDDLKVKGTGVTAYRVGVNAVTRIIEGTAKVNGVPGWTYQVEVTDNGERGRTDVFTIRLFAPGIPFSETFFYSASGTLGGGNIQLHTNRGHGRGCDDDDDDDDHDSDDDDHDSDDDDHDSDDDDDDDDH